MEGLTFNLMNFVTSLKYMGIGMLAVFLIVGIIMAATYGISKLSIGKKKDEE